MKRTYTDQEMIRILKQELVIPDKVDQGMQDAYKKLGIKRSGKISFARKHRMWHVLAAAAVIAAGSSIVVVAANKFLSANLVKEKDSVAYELAIDRGQTAHKIEVTPTYIPAGYELGAENTPYAGKWHNQETGGTLVISSMNAAELDEQIRLGNAKQLTHGMKEKNLVEELELNGTKAALFMPDSAFVDSTEERLDMMLFNEDEGYLVTIYNSSLPKDEVMKIARGLDIQILDSTVSYKTDAEINSILAEQEASKKQLQAEMAPHALAENNFFSVGTELKVPFLPAEDGTKPEDIRYTVESVEVKDRLPASEYPAENFHDYDGEMAAWLNEDGTLKPHERYKYTLNPDGSESGDPVVETVNSKFVVVNMKLKNNNEVNQFGDDVMVCPLIEYLTVDGNAYSKSYTKEYRRANEDYHLQIDGFPVYFDKMYNTEGTKRAKSFHFVPMQPGEELEYTLVYVVDEDRLDNAFFHFYSGYGGWPIPEGGNEFVYVKVQQ